MVKRTAAALAMAAWFFCGAAPAHARKQKPVQNDPAVTAMVAKALAASDIESGGSPAFQLEARIEVEMGEGAAETGKLLWIWTPGGWSHDEVSLADYHSLEISAGDQLWLKSSADYLPFPLYLSEQAVNVWDWLDRANGEQLGKPEAFTSSGETCVATSRHSGKDESTSRRYCFDTLSGNLTRVVDDSWNLTFLYSDYAPFGRKSFPRLVQVLRNGDEPFLRIRIVQLAAEARPDLRLFLPVAGARQMPALSACGKIVPAKLVKMVQPELPRAARQAGISGIVKLYAEVGTDGIPRGLWPVNSTPPVLATAAMQAVSQWRYRPRACQSGGTPLRQVEQLTLVFSSP